MRGTYDSPDGHYAANYRGIFDNIDCLGDITQRLEVNVFLPIIWLVTIAPISLKSMGIREVAFILFFDQAGLMRDSALALLRLVNPRRFFSYVVRNSLSLLLHESRQS